MNRVKEPMLLVLCTGNICRSPMAETMFAHYISERGLSASVLSRGLAAPTGKVPHPYAISVMSAHGFIIDPEKRSMGVTSAEMAAATAVFVMDGGHRKTVQQLFPSATGKTFLLGQWQAVEIVDPINEPISAFEAAWNQIDRGAQAWVERLEQADMLKQRRIA